MKFLLLQSPWRSEFEKLISKSTKELLIAAPYYSNNVANEICRLTGKRIAKRVLLALSQHDVQGGAQSIDAIKTLRADSSCKVKFIREPKLHAKFIVSDKKSSIVTSSNLTDRGLDTNFEVGIRINDRRLATELTKQFDHLWRYGKEISEGELRKFARMAIRVPKRRGRTFGGKAPRQAKRKAMEKIGWILVHSEKQYPDEDFKTPQSELDGESKLYGWPLDWRWIHGRGPMKPDGKNYIVLLAFKGMVFGRANATIKTNSSDPTGRSFFFVLDNYEKREEVPLAPMAPEGYRDLILLDANMLKKYDRLSAGNHGSTGAILLKP